MNNSRVLLRSIGPNTEKFAKFLNFKGVFFQEKRNVKWMRLLGKLNPSFLTHVTTTIGNTIYLPDISNKDDIGMLKTLAHEYVHVLDYRKNMFFLPSYMFPQLFGVLSLLSIGGLFNPFFYLFGLFGLCFLKLPSPFRLKWEIRGYAMTLAMEKWLYGSISKQAKQEVVKVLKSPTYWMTFDGEYLIREIKDKVASIENNTILKDPAFKQVNTYLKQNKLLK